MVCRQIAFLILAIFISTRVGQSADGKHGHDFYVCIDSAVLRKLFLMFSVLVRLS